MQPLHYAQALTVICEYDVLYVATRCHRILAGSHAHPRGVIQRAKHVPKAIKR